MTRTGTTRLLKLRYGRTSISINCLEEITGNLVVAGAMKVGKTTFLRSLQTILDPRNIRTIYGSELAQLGIELPRTLLLGKTTIRGVGERKILDFDNVPIFTTTERFNYLGVVTYLIKQDKEGESTRNYSKITLRIFDTPGYCEEPIIQSLGKVGIDKVQLEAWRDIAFRITSVLEYVIRSFPTIVTVLVSPGGPIAEYVGKNGYSLIDPTDQHGLSTLREIIAEMTNTHCKTVQGFAPFLDTVPLLVAFTKTDHPGPRVHFEKARARAKTFRGVDAILNLSSVPYARVDEVWQQTECFLWEVAALLNTNQRSF